MTPICAKGWLLKMKKIMIGVVTIMFLMVKPCSCALETYGSSADNSSDVIIYCVEKYVPISENEQAIYTFVVSRDKTTNIERILFEMNEDVGQLFKIGDYIFVHTINGIYKCSINGVKKQLILNEKIRSYTVSDDNIFYCLYNDDIEHFQIMKCDLDGNNKTLLAEKKLAEKLTVINEDLIYSDRGGVNKISGDNHVVTYMTTFVGPMPGGEIGRHFIIDDKIIISGYAKPEEYYKQYGYYPTIILGLNGNIVDIWGNCWIHHIEKSNGKIYAQIDNMCGDGGNTITSRGIYYISDDFKEKRLVLDDMWSNQFEHMYIKENNIYFASKFGDWFKGNILGDGTIENIVAEPKTIYSNSFIVVIIRQIPSGGDPQYYRELIAFDVPPIIENDRVLVPMRAIFEALGATVDWDGNTKTVTAKKDDIEISMQIGNDILYKNSEKIALDVPAKIVDNRTIVPIRAVSEGLGARVEWNETARAVYIYTD